ncbi:hypothetical protein ACLEDY_09260 [Lonsdalea quercina]|uniref:hypothetical protein n=1 Tax=Lonsdalea quercina TaxID=71657 RepID=UPI00397691D7
METLFVIGMFKSQSKRFYAECNRRNIRYYPVLADVGKQGIMGLVPTPHDAVLAFQEWLKNENEEYDKLHIIQLPYCEITADMENELEVAVEFGATLITPEAGLNGWPGCLSRRNKADTDFLNIFFRKITELLPAVVEPEVSISEHYKQVAAVNPRVIFSPHVYHTCDAVASHRISFMKDAANALSELLLQPLGCRNDVFFREKGIEHAQTGGIVTHLNVVSANSIEKYSSEMHLKKGDKTSGAAAVRIYYHFIYHDSISYVVVLYAGPHPESDISWQLQLPVAPCPLD